MNQVKVSVLIPVYNRRDIVKYSIQSVLQQTYHDYELIIVDNCSTDGTYEYLMEKYGNNEKIFLFQNKENIGPVGNWRRCFEESHGKYIKFLWSDDRLEDTFLEKTVKCLEENRNAAFAMTNVAWEKINSLETKKTIGWKLNLKKVINKIFHRFIHQNTGYYVGNTGEYSYDSYVDAHFTGKKACLVSPSAALFRRECWKMQDEIENRFGVSLKNTGAGIDVLQFLESFSNSDSFYYIDEKLSVFGMHAKSITASNNLDIEYWIADKYWLDSTVMDEHMTQTYHKRLAWKILKRQDGKEIIEKLYNNGDSVLPTVAEKLFWNLGSCMSKLKRKIAYYWEIK